ncbi:hypothetical protein HNR19_000383 [Nocardioides thalensis]|uniref:Uncharacterized protein n=1 Tax=Nocardioides thalensis TaxID=1914755 RepID=A0A853BX45_9ACTN|nr:hypothetical protein [Nocardioides thalensis]NYI99684.1 hypothetical protein [Nocardioides thalensis]
MDLRDRFEVAFDDTPEARSPHRSIDDRLRAGRATVRRRRAAGVAGGIAAAAVVGTVGWQLIEPEPPTVVEAPYASVVGAPNDTDWPVVEDPDAKEIEVNPDHEIVVPPGTRFVRTISDPLGEINSIAFEAAVPGVQGTLFYLADDRRGVTSQSDPSGEYYTTLALWAENAGLVAGSGAFNDQLAVGDDGRLVSTDPALEIVAQLEDPEIGPEFAGPAERTVAAEVRLDGVTWFLVGQYSPDHREHAAFYRVEPTVLEDRTVEGVVAHVNALLEAEVAAEGDR